MKLSDILGLINALSPLVTGVVTRGHVQGALIGAGVLTAEELAADADLNAIITEAFTFKAEADRAAAGQDPR